MSYAPATKPFNRLALIGILCPALGLIAGLVWIGLGLASASTQFGDFVSPVGITVAALLVPVLYVLGIVFGVVAFRRWKRLGGRGLAIAAIVVSSALLVLTAVGVVVAGLLFNLLAQSGG
jgi:hypothetical protein